MRSQGLFSLPTTHENTITFTLVGMGMTGNALFCQLVEKLIQSDHPSAIKIELYEENPEFFLTGSTYQTNSPAIWTLNNLAEKFNLTTSGDNVAVWMKKNPDIWRAQFPDIDEGYVPRALVGLYLKDQYAHYKKIANIHGIKVKENFCRIIDVSATSEKKWQIITEDSQRRTDFLFLCLGHVAVNNFPHLKSSPHYFHSSCNIDALKEIPKSSPIYILGGQATFVDLALWLSYVNNHTGDIYTITRNRPIITSKDNIDECDKNPVEELTKHLTDHYASHELSLTQSKSLLWNTYQKAAKNPVDINNLPTTQETLTYQLSKYDSKPLPDIKGNIDELRSFIFNFYMGGCYKVLWEKLREEDQLEFNNALSSTIFAFLTGITPLNARLLLELYKRETIKEYFGLTKITHNKNDDTFVLHFKDGQTKEASYLIDATGFGYNLNANLEEFPLLKNLVEKGFIVPKAAGGIHINEGGQAFSKENCIQENLFCLGPIASYGHQFPTPYASFIAVNAVENALKMLSFSMKNNNVKTLVS